MWDISGKVARGRYEKSGKHVGVAKVSEKKRKKN